MVGHIPSAQTGVFPLLAQLLYSGQQSDPIPGAPPQSEGSLRRGARGDDVRVLQRALNAAGANPPLAEDGIFGPLTEGALQGFQGGQNLPRSGVADVDTQQNLLRALQERWYDALPAMQGNLRAPQVGGEAPEGAMPASDLISPDRFRPGAPRPRSATRGARPSNTQGRSTPASTRSSAPAQTAARTPAPQPATQGAPVAPQPATQSAPVAASGPPPTGPADARLAQIQGRAMDSARRELAANVHEDLGPNRGTHVDRYAQDAGMRPGYEWCGFFSSYNLSQAAQEAGGSFNGRHQMHSLEKARSYFAYRNYTNNSRTENGRLDDLQRQHEAQGSTRRFMTFPGSGGDRWATQNHRPHENFDYGNIPLRAGDTALFSRGHVGLVESYDQRTGQLTTIEGNTAGGRVARHTYDLSDPAVRARFEGFGRPALADFNLDRSGSAAAA